MTHARLDSTPRAALPRPDGRAVEWRVSPGLTGYDEAVAAMETRVDAIARGAAAELVWLVEHPPLYTAGTSAGVARNDAAEPPSPFWGGARGGGPCHIPGEESSADNTQRGEPPSLTLPHKGEGDRAASTSPQLQQALPFPLHPTGRGGQVTYHGPGQRVAYVMLDLSKRRQDVRAFVAALERWIVDTLAAFDVAGERREDRVGVWVRRPDKAAGLDGTQAQERLAEDKIAAIGIRVRRWVTFHGISLNVAPDLAHYAAITPCGIAASHLGVTSLADLGRPMSLAAADAALARAFVPIFGPVIRL